MQNLDLDTDEFEYFKRLNFLIRLALRIIFAIAGAIITVVVVVALINLTFYGMDYFDLTDTPYRFRVPGRSLFTLLIGAYFFWVKTPAIYNKLLFRYSYSKPFRYFVLLSFFYGVCLLGYIHLFEPRPFTRGLDLYRYGRLDSKFWELLKWLGYPMLCLAFGMYLFSKAKPKDFN